LIYEIDFTDTQAVRQRAEYTADGVLVDLDQR